ncbi:MAG: LacI family DNA-binding transcriptional regulator [Brevinema sp.]
MTIREIANLAGLSPTTVHRALNNPDKIKPEIRQLIDNILSKTILEDINLKKLYVILPHINEFYTKFIIDLITALNKYDIEIIPFITYEDKVKEHHFISSIPFSSKIGLIWTPTDPDRNYSFLHRTKNKPLVIFFNRRLNITTSNSSIILDNHSALNIAVEELYKNQNTKILFINGQKNLETSVSREQGFLSAIESYRIKYYSIEYSDFQNWLSSYQVMGKICNKLIQYDAVIAGNELISYGILKKLKELNLEISKDIRIISIDNSYSLESQKISTIYFSTNQIADRITQILLDNLRDPMNSSSYYITPRVKLRGSEARF